MNINQNKPYLSFPVWRYLHQLLFKATAESIKSPWKFWDLYNQTQLLEHCWQQDCVELLERCWQQECKLQDHPCS